MSFMGGGRLGFSKPAFMYILQQETRPLKKRRGHNGVKLPEKCRTYCHRYSRWLTRNSRLIWSGAKMQSLPSAKDITTQGKVLCRDYVYSRLRRNGLMSAKVEAQLAAAGNKPSTVSQELQTIGAELEKMYPHLYQNVSRQLNHTMSSEAMVRDTYVSLADHMFKSGVVTWGRVVAMFAIAGGFAVDCVQQGHADFVEVVVETFGKITTKHFSQWIARQGGWNDVLRAFRTTAEATTLWALTGLGALVGFVFTFIAVMQV